MPPRRRRPGAWLASAEKNTTPLHYARSLARSLARTNERTNAAISSRVESTPRLAAPRRSSQRRRQVAGRSRSPRRRNLELLGVARVPGCEHGHVNFPLASPVPKWPSRGPNYRRLASRQSRQSHSSVLALAVPTQVQEPRNSAQGRQTDGCGAAGQLLSGCWRITSPRCARRGPSRMLSRVAASPGGIARVQFPAALASWFWWAGGHGRSAAHSACPASAHAAQAALAQLLRTMQEHARRDTQGTQGHAAALTPQSQDQLSGQPQPGAGCEACRRLNRGKPCCRRRHWPHKPINVSLCCSPRPSAPPAPRPPRTIRYDDSTLVPVRVCPWPLAPCLRLAREQKQISARPYTLARSLARSACLSLPSSHSHTTAHSRLRTGGSTTLLLLLLAATCDYLLSHSSQFSSPIYTPLGCCCPRLWRLAHLTCARHSTTLSLTHPHTHTHTHILPATPSPATHHTQRQHRPPTLRLGARLALALVLDSTRLNNPCDTRHDGRRRKEAARRVVPQRRR